MKIINYTHLYLEHYLAGISQEFCFEKFTSAEQMENNFFARNIIKKQLLVHEIINTCKTLKKYKSVAGLIPDETANAQKKFFYKKEQAKKILTPFFAMLSQLEKNNDSARRRWKSEIRDCARRFDIKTEDFFNCFTQLHPHTVVINRDEEKNSLSITTSEYLWGIADITFKNINTSNEITPMSARLTCIEAQRGEDENGNDIFTVSLLIDTKKETTPMRCFEDDGWINLTFTCSGFEVEALPFDYSDRLCGVGIDYYSIMRGCMCTLESKANSLGIQYLTPGEKNLLPISRLFCALTLCNNPLDCKSEINYDLIYDALGSTDDYNKINSVLGAVNTDFANTFKDSLKKIAEKTEDDDLYSAALSLRALRRYAVAVKNSGEFESTALCFTKMFREVTETLEKVNMYSSEYEFTSRQIDNITKEIFSSLGFSGTFPHYRRIYKGKKQFLTFKCEGCYLNVQMGLVRIDFSVSAASEKYFSFAAGNKNDIKFEDLNAECAQNLTEYKYSRFGGEKLNASMFLPISSENDEQQVKDFFTSFSKKLFFLINAALSALLSNSLPAAYRMELFKTYPLKKAVSESALKALPLFAISFICIALALLNSNIITPEYIILTLIIVALIYLAGMLVLTIREYFKVWKRK